MPIRYAFDIGSSSIGWVVLHINADGNLERLIDAGVRLFHDGRDPKSKGSLAVDRRDARAMRRRRDRTLLRKKALMRALIQHGLMPQDEAGRKALETEDPYTFRKEALDGEIPVHHVGRALFHLHQRRGFKSNRKTDGGEDGKIRVAGKETAEKMAAAGARTLGEFFALMREDDDKAEVRARPVMKGQQIETYTFYPQRWMLEDEFDQIWAAQSPHHPVMTEEARDAIRTIMFRQRPLREVDPGKCALVPTEDRVPKAFPMFQRFRIYMELANIKIREPDNDYRERRLNQKERDLIAGELLKRQKFSFAQIRKKLKLSADHGFNIESDRRPHLDGNVVAYALSNKKCFGEDWFVFSEEARDTIVDRLLNEEDPEALKSWLMDEFTVSDEAAEKIMKTGLPDGHARLGPTALATLTEIMRDQGLEYASAVREAGWHHSDFRPGEQLPELPYYGEALQGHVIGTGKPEDPLEKRVGRIPNPTVHIGLNQIRRLTNAMIREFGRPDEIIVELARELKLGPKKVREIESEQTKFQKANDDRRAHLDSVGERDTGANRLMLRLYEELPSPQKPCVYCGKTIGQADLFSGDIDIDHILPFSRTLDNSVANKVIVHNHCNRAKGNMTPWEKWSSDDTRIETIMAIAEELPGNKRWRFQPDAMERFEENDGGFIARQLVDTQYLSRVAKQYFGHVCNPDNVWVSPGRLTAMLRGKWGVNDILTDSNLGNMAVEKNRMDHRHHAIDAFVIGCTDRGLLNRISRDAARYEYAGDDRILQDIQEPGNGAWPTWREDLRSRLLSVVVSHKPDHGVSPGQEKNANSTSGRLHEDTAYGLVKDPEAEDGHNLVRRKPLAGLTPKECTQIRDLTLREQVLQWLYEAEQTAGEKLSTKQHAEALALFSRQSGINRVRVLKKEEGVIEIAEPGGAPYKAYSPGDNQYVDIYELPDGKWIGLGVTAFDANQPPGRRRSAQKPPAGARKVMRLFKGDMVKLSPTEGEPEAVMLVKKLNLAANRVFFVGNYDAGDPQKRHDLPNDVDPFRWLILSFGKFRERKARKVGVDVLGRVNDPGPPLPAPKGT